MFLRYPSRYTRSSQLVYFSIIDFAMAPVSIDSIINHNPSLWSSVTMKTRIQRPDGGSHIGAPKIAGFVLLIMSAIIFLFLLTAHSKQWLRWRWSNNNSRADEGGIWNESGLNNQDGAVPRSETSISNPNPLGSRSLSRQSPAGSQYEGNHHIVTIVPESHDPQIPSSPTTPQSPIAFSPPSYPLPAYCLRPQPPPTYTPTLRSVSPRPSSISSDDRIRRRWGRIFTSDPQELEANPWMAIDAAHISFW